MRYFEIIAEKIGDTWSSRFAQFQQQQARRTKLRRKLATATAKANQHHHAAAAQRSRDHDRLADLRRQMTKPDPSS